MNLNDIANTFAKHTQNIAAISLANCWINEVSVPHMVHGAFKNLAAIGLGTGFTFE
jgi:large subunit ribosomal protein LP0